MAKKLNAEQQRLAQDASREQNWKRFGPYLAERQWGTVREDYSADGSSWNYFPFEQAAGRAYRWGEDGLLGFTDRECRLCFALALWNGRDPFLKERLFGLTNTQGNHGEDVKECYFYLDATPTYSYCKALYKYPHHEFPYARLYEENARRTRNDPEFELIDTGIFDENRYFDVTVEYAKASPNDVLIRITAANRGPESAKLHLLPTLWFRNTWTWGCAHEGCTLKPWLWQTGPHTVLADHESLGKFVWQAGPGLQMADCRLQIENAVPTNLQSPISNLQSPRLLFTDNETNIARLFQAANLGPYVKDAFHDYVIHGRSEAINPKNRGTKAAAQYVLDIPAGAAATIRLRLWPEAEAPIQPLGPKFDEIFADRIQEADAFYDDLLNPRDSKPQGEVLRTLGVEDARISRQAYAGLLWSKQFYHYVVADWLAGDANEPRPPVSRKNGRNNDWGHLFNRDVISMPDKWEYPWYAAWDLAFHMIPMAHVDPDFAREQLILLLREWYMHPSGKLPAYEWNFNDVNPPVHAWACWRVYKIAACRGAAAGGKKHGERDRVFLARVFHKLLIDFTWWINRKDIKGKHLFAGGFLGMDNISLFDRSRPLRDGAVLEQADGTAWMAFYCGTMLSIALELAKTNPAYQDVASKFFEHFVAIADAMNTLGGAGLWDEQDGFYYDQMHADGQSSRLRIRSLVGLIPLLAVEVLSDDVIAHVPGFRKRMQWFLDHRKDFAQHIACLEPDCGASGQPAGGKRLLAIPSRPRLERVLAYVLDEKEFLSPHGIRSLSRIHKDHPFECGTCGTKQRVDYEPAESRSAIYGGNSNWRGPIWMPINYLLIEALERYHHFYGDAVRVECPTGSGKRMNLQEVAHELAARLAGLFRPDAQGSRVCHGPDRRFAEDPHWRDLLLFHEYFDGDTGLGLGASHQTGWTALITRLLKDCSAKG